MDADGWRTKAETATALGVGERTVERLAARGVLTARMRPGFPTMYNPDDVRRLASGARTVHRGAISPADGNGHGLGALVPAGAGGAEQLVERLVWFLELLGARLAEGPTGPTGPTPEPPLCVGLAQAAALTGLSKGYLRRQVEAGNLTAAVDGRRLKFWRDDLKKWRP